MQNQALLFIKSIKIEKTLLLLEPTKVFWDWLKMIKKLDNKLRPLFIDYSIFIYVIEEKLSKTSKLFSRKAIKDALSKAFGQQKIVGDCFCHCYCYYEQYSKFQILDQDQWPSNISVSWLRYFWKLYVLRLC